jgi:thioredoxin 1
MREITINELKELQLQGKNILVDVKAKWCMPCRQLIPLLENIEKSYNNVEFVTIDVDDNQEGCIELGIRSVPTVMIYKNGELIDRSSGANPDTFYKKILNDL